MANPLRSNPVDQLTTRPLDVCLDGAVPQYPPLPCALGHATHHHLDCGHLIRTKLPSACGTNCVQTPATYSTRSCRFACTRCIDTLLDAKILQRLALLDCRVGRRMERATGGSWGEQGLEALSWEAAKWREERVKIEKTLRVGTRESDDAGDTAGWETKIRVRVSRLSLAQLAEEEMAIRLKQEEYAKKVRKANDIARSLERLI